MKDFDEFSATENEKDRLIIDLQHRNADLEQKIKALEEQLQFETKIRSYNLELQEIERGNVAYELREDALAKVYQLMSKVGDRETLSKEDIQSIQHFLGLLDKTLVNSTSNLHPYMTKYPLYRTLPYFAEEECAKAELNPIVAVDDELADKFFAHQIENLIYKIVRRFINKIAAPAQATQCNITLTWDKAPDRLLLELFSDKSNFSLSSDSTINDFKEHYTSLEDFLRWGESLREVPGYFEVIIFKHWVVDVQGTFTMLSSPESGIHIKINVPALPKPELNASYEYAFR